MKRCMTLFVGMLVFCFQANAQLTQGNVIIGLSSNFFGGGNGITAFNPNTAGVFVTSFKVKNGDVESDTENRTAFNLSPSVAYFVMDNLAVGASLGFDYSKWENDDDGETIIGISPFGRYYLDLEKLKPYGQLGFGIGSYSFGSDDEDKESIFHWGIGVGIAVFINDKISLDIATGYTSETYTEKEDSDMKYIYNTFGLSFGLSMFL